MNDQAKYQLELADQIGAVCGSSLAIKLGGDLCYDSAHHVVQTVRESLGRRPEKLILDLEAVQIIDSSGLRALLLSRKACEEVSVSFEIRSPSDIAVRLIRMSGFADLFGLPHIELLEGKVAPEGAMSGSWVVREHMADSDPSVLSALRQMVTESAIEAGAAGDTLCDIQIAVGEALTNAYRHGSPNKGKDRISLACMTCPRALVVEIEDEGRPFDPSKVTPPDPRRLRNHGMGIYLMRQAMDVVEFRTGCPGNKVRMIKWLRGAGDS